MPAKLKKLTVPPPMGMNSLSAGPEMDQGDAIYIWNMLRGEYGLRTRLGWAEQATGIYGSDYCVRTIVPYKGSASSGSRDRLFACTTAGIWDVTASGIGAWRALTPYSRGTSITSGALVFLCSVGGASGAIAPTATAVGQVVVDGTVTWVCASLAYAGSAPSLVVAWPIPTGQAGFCTAVATSNSAGNRFIALADEANGYWVYTESSNSWAQITQGSGANQIAGIDPTKVCHVASYQHRLWLVIKDTSQALYLPFYAIIDPGGLGAVFDFAPQFRSGGGLVGLYNWAYDSGGALTNYLVGISTGGDICIYGGIDPATAGDFSLFGVWFVGGVPVGRQIATNFGGDVLILANLGVVPLSKLVIGANTIFDKGQYLTAKISNLFNTYVQQFGLIWGWSIRIHPNDNALIVTIPQGVGVATLQLVMQLETRGWSQYRGMPFFSCEAWNGQLYFGTSDGRVAVNSGYLDGVSLAVVAGTVTSIPVAFSFQTAFSSLGQPNRKVMKMVRATFISQGGAPSWAAQARYTYDFTEASTAGIVAATVVNGWDSAIWDQSDWSGQYQPAQTIFGLSGMGNDCAIAMAGNTFGRTSLVSMDVFWQDAGSL